VRGIRGGREGWRDERSTVSRWTCLVLGIRSEELAVEMCGQDNVPHCILMTMNAAEKVSWPAGLSFDVVLLPLTDLTLGFDNVPELDNVILNLLNVD
jgi:hypothetical protein